MNTTTFRPEACERVIRRLDGYLDREIPAAECEEIARHLELCPLCAGEASVRRGAQTRLRAAVTNAEAMPPFLEARIRNTIRSSERGRAWFPRWAAVSAALVVCSGAFIAYQLGHLRFTASSQDAYISSVSRSVSSMMRVGLRDHIHCAVFRKFPRNAPTLAELAAKLPASYRGLLDIVREKTPQGYRVMLAHECKYQGRRFVHLAMQSDAKLLSVVITRKGDGESFGADKLIPALTESGLPLYREGVQRFQIAGFESRDHLVYVISDMPGSSNMQLMLALAPEVKEFLDRLPA